MFSDRPPLDLKKTRGKIESCMGEVCFHFFYSHHKKVCPLKETGICYPEHIQVNLHLKKLRERHSEFKLAPHKTQYDPNREEEMLRTLFPQVKYFHISCSHGSQFIVSYNDNI